MSSATPLPVRRDPQHGYLGGVCAGFAARVGIDPLLIRIGFIIAVALGGVAIPLYAIAWVLIPAEGPERPVIQRLLTRSDTWLVAAGSLVWLAILVVGILMDYAARQVFGTT